MLSTVTQLQKECGNEALGRLIVKHYRDESSILTYVVQKNEKIDRRAQQLGMKRSDYLRYLVDADLVAAGV